MRFLFANSFYRGVPWRATSFNLANFLAAFFLFAIPVGYVLEPFPLWSALRSTALYRPSKQGRCSVDPWPEHACRLPAADLPLLGTAHPFPSIDRGGPVT